MERTNLPIREKSKELSPRHIQALMSVITARAELAAKMGIQYNGKRDIYSALGYKDSLVYTDFMAKYLRQDIAQAVINRPVTSTWRGKVELIESDITEDTVFEEEWERLDKKLGIKSRLARVDKLTGIGQYGILLLGLDDVKNKQGFALPVGSGKRTLKYLSPYGEGSAKIIEYVQDPKNERYGKPLYYEISISNNETSGSVSSGSTTVKVHYTRILHIIDNPLESDVLGLPRLQAVFNRLDDLEKIVGGDGETFWRGARPGFKGKVDKEFALTPQQEDKLLAQLDEYDHNLRRFLINEGIDIDALAQQIADPATHVDVQLQMISAITGIPKRILTGSERGELSSAQDSEEWKDYVQARREDYAELQIVRPFVDRLIELQILPTPESGEYYVRWSDIYSQSEKAQVELGKARASAIREYTYNPMGEAIIPPDAFLEFCLGLNPEQITLIRAMRDKVISEEELNAKVVEAIEQETAPPVVKPATPAPVKKVNPSLNRTK